MKDRTGRSATGTRENEQFVRPATVIVASHLVDELTDQQRRDALLHLCGATPQRVIAAFAAVAGG